MAEHLLAKVYQLLARRPTLVRMLSYLTHLCLNFTEAKKCAKLRLSETVFRIYIINVFLIACLVINCCLDFSFIALFGILLYM